MDEIRYGDVLRAVEEFLRRYRDAFTRAHRDDLAQEAAIETWRRSGSLRASDRAEAFARTVARRLRFHALRRARRRGQFPGPGRDHRPVERLDDVVDRCAASRAYRVAGEWLDAGWCERQIDDVLRGLGPLNGGIVREYYRGSSCAEIGERYGVPTAGVKARLHRSRLRIRETIVDRARCAGDQAGGAGCSPVFVPEKQGERT